MRALRWHFIRWVIVALLTGLGSLLPYFSEAAPVSVPELIEGGQYTQALDQLKEQLKSARTVDSQSLLWSEIAKIYFDYLHDYDATIRSYQRILKLQNKGLSDADQLLAQFQMAKAYARKGQHDKAMELYREILQTHTAGELAYQMAQRFLQRTQRALAKVKEYQEWLRENEESALAVEMKFQLAEVLLKELDRPEAAITHYRRIVRDFPDHALAIDALWRIANTYHKTLHQRAEAIQAYRQVMLRYAPSQYAAEAEFQLGRLYAAQHEFRQAAQRLEHLIENYPTFWRLPAAYYWLGDCYEKQGEFLSAIDALKTFLRVYLPTADPALLGDIGRHGESKLKVQAELEERIRRLEVQLPKALLTKAEEQAQAGNSVAALASYRQLIAQAPQTEYAQTARERLEETAFRAELQLLQSRLNEAALSPVQHAALLYRMGEIYEHHLGNPMQAITNYSKIVGLGLKSWAARAAYRIGILYAQEPGKQQALLAYRNVIHDYPESSEAMMANYQMAEIFRSQQKYQEALDAYRNTMTYPGREWYLGEGTSYSFAEISQFRIGRIYYDNLRNYAEALKTFQEFIEAYPHSPRLGAAYVMIAQIQEDRGNLDAARQAYMKARDLAYGSEIQASHIVDEISQLDFPGRDPLNVGKRLQMKLRDLDVASQNRR